MLLDNDSKEEIDATKISNSSKNPSKTSNSLTIMTTIQRDIHHLAINKNDKEIKDSFCFDMFSLWEPNLEINIFILTEYQQDYDTHE